MELIPYGELSMDWEQVSHNWQQAGARPRAVSGKLTDADVVDIDGDREWFLPMLHGRYRNSEKRAAELIVNFSERLGTAMAGLRVGA